MDSKLCTLCAGSLPHHPIVEEESHFCCPGCHAVYQILSAKEALLGAKEHPLFKEALAAGLISNPALLEEFRAEKVKVPPEELNKHYFEVEDLWCPSCAEVISWMLLREKGVTQCTVDYSTDLVVVEYSPRHLSKGDVERVVKKLGYTPKAIGAQEEGSAKASRGLSLRFTVAAFFTLNIMMFSYPLYASYFAFDVVGYSHLFAYLSLAGSLPVVTYCFWPIVRRFFNGLQLGLLGMEALVTIGVTAAFGLSLFELFSGGVHVYFDSMSVVITLILLGKIIESRAKFSAKKALYRLIRALPRRGRKQLADGKLRYVPLKEIAPGDKIVVFSGEKVVMDGKVIEGEGSCDESLMTGEVFPVMKQKGASVVAGTLLQSGSLVIEVSTKAEESVLQKILNVVEGDLSHKSGYVRAADKIMSWFVPAVLTVALAVALSCWLFSVADAGKTIAETAMLRAISVLLISCPCAIGIAAPLAEAHLLKGLAKAGALVRNRGSLALLGLEDVVVFDKTGTVTEGHFQIKGSELQRLSPLHRRLLKGVAMQSVHPISSAITSSLSDVEHERSIKVQEFPGSGLLGEKGKNRLLLGSLSFLKKYGVALPEVTENSEEIETIVHFAINDTHVATLRLGDSLRAEAPSVIAALAPVERVLLSGDGETAVAATAHAAGFDHWQSRCHPLEKREYIAALRQEGKRVTMIGDGINDAPALTVADVGISVISATDISIQVSDLLLTTDKLSVLPTLFRLAKRGRRIVHQNLFWAFFYNMLGIPLAAFGLLTPLFAAAAMVLSSLIVLVNARRARVDS